MIRLNRGPALLLFVLSFASFSSAASASLDEASQLFQGGETAVESSVVALGERFYNAVSGSKGSLLFFDAESTLVEDAGLMESLSRALSLREAQKQNASRAVASLTSAIQACNQAYANFANDARPCTEQAFLKYRCGFLWQTGLSEGILKFSIANAKKNIEPALASLNASASSLENELFASRPKQEKIASYLSEINSSLSGFSEWHSKMVSYEPFAQEGRLSGCNLSAADGQALAKIVFPADSTQLLAKARRSLEAARASPRYQLHKARRAQAEYEQLLLNISQKFSAVRGTSLDFVFTDYAALSNATASLEENTTAKKASAHASLLAEKSARLEAVEKTLPSYSRAVHALENASAALTALTAVDHKIYAETETKLDVLLLEVEEKMSAGEVNAREVESLAASAEDFYASVVSLKLPSPAGSQNTQSIDFPRIALAAIGLLALAVIALRAWRTRHRRYEKW